MGCDTGYVNHTGTSCIFKSTQPEWAATKGLGFSIGTPPNLNPRSPSGLRRLTGSNGLAECIFKSTQPEWAATAFLLPTLQRGEVFKSTQPEWAATLDHYQVSVSRDDLNPRSPSGLRQSSTWQRRYCFIFKSTQPEWAATEIINEFAIEKIFKSTQPEWAATGY